MKGSVDEPQKEQPAEGISVPDCGVNLSEAAEESHSSSRHKEADARKQDFASQIRAVNLEFLITEFDQGIGQGPADHDKHGKEDLESIIF